MIKHLLGVILAALIPVFAIWGLCIILKEVKKAETLNHRKNAPAKCLFFVEDAELVKITEQQTKVLEKFKQESINIGEIFIAKSVNFYQLLLIFDMYNKDNVDRPSLAIPVPNPNKTKLDYVYIPKYSYYESNFQTYTIEYETANSVQEKFKFYIEITGEDKDQWKGYVLDQLSGKDKLYLINPLGDGLHVIREVKYFDATKEVYVSPQDNK